MFPLRLGSDQQFQGLRAALASANYTEEAICGRVGIERLQWFKPLREGRPGDAGITDSLDALIRLLMDGEPVAAAVLNQHLVPGAVEVMLALDLVRPLPDDAATLGATAHLYPLRGLFIASDRTFPIGSTDTKLPDDVVYSAITTNTGRFLSYVPSDPCGTLLDLCSGAGAAALIGAASYADHAWATDLGARSVHFSEFNARLNGLRNLSAVQGDLFDAVKGLAFDRILAHPPYIPADAQKILFRDGGSDGEQIFRRIVEGVPDHLNPGGRAYILTRATDRVGAPLQKRIREWLGGSHSEFDVFLVLQEELIGPEQAERIASRLQGEPVQLGPDADFFRALHATALLYGVVVIERHTDLRTPLTARCRKSISSASEVVEWFRRWQLASSESTFPALIMETRPRPSPRFRLEIAHAFRDGALAPVDFRLKSDYPYVSEARIEPWVAFLLGLCDGSRTAREVFDELRSQEVLDQENSTDEFVAILSQLLGSGFLEIPEFSLPRPVPRSEDR